MDISPTVFKLLTEYIYEQAGLVISEEKKYLVPQRLEPLLRELNCRSWEEFYSVIQARNTPALTSRIIDAMTTNETSFFRDGHPFDALRSQILLQLSRLAVARASREVVRRGPKLRIWSAASSTGQEAYSIAMMIDELVRGPMNPGIQREDFEILATDISSQVLAQAIRGRYNKLEISRGMPLGSRERYFRQEADNWVLREDVRSMVEFRQLNLMGNLTQLGAFDLILVRNVLIYFNDETKKRILQQMHTMMNRDGILMLGSTESMYGLGLPYKSETVGGTMVYRPVV